MGIRKNNGGKKEKNGEEVILYSKPVSYTHLDVYKRQVLRSRCMYAEFSEIKNMLHSLESLSACSRAVLQLEAL